jgi:hypothetical protein
VLTKFADSGVSDAEGQMRFGIEKIHLSSSGVGVEIKSSFSKENGWEGVLEISGDGGHDLIMDLEEGVDLIQVDEEAEYGVKFNPRALSNIMLPVDNDSDLEESIYINSDDNWGSIINVAKVEAKMSDWMKQRGLDTNDTEARRDYLVREEMFTHDQASEYETKRMALILRKQNDQKLDASMRTIIDFGIGLIDNPEIMALAPKILVDLINSGLNGRVVSKISKTADGKLLIHTKELEG